MKALALAIVLGGCGSSTAPPAPASGCALTVDDVRTNAKPACITQTFETDAPRAAELVAQLDWVKFKDTARQLATLTVAPEAWYRIAVKLDASPRAALSALQLSRFHPTAPDSRAIAEIDLAIIRVATKIKSEGDVRASVERLLANGKLGGSQKLQLLDLLANRGDQQSIEQLCRTAIETGIAWRCLELAPDLDESIAACAELPVLSFSDIEHLVWAKKKLPGLRCTSDGPRGLASMFERVEHDPPAQAAVALLYSRLATDAPPSAHACFLEEAALVCLQQIQQGRGCPVLTSFADYLATVPETKREAAMDALIELKNRDYQLLHSGSNDAKGILFHIHVLLAESAIAKPSRDMLTLAQYHVKRAAKFWDVVRDPTLSFADALSKPLREYVCNDRQCTAACANTTWGGCVQSCKLDDETWTTTCGTP